MLFILLLNLVAFAAGLIWILLVKTGPFNFNAYLILSLYTLLLNLFFGMAGLFISTLIRKAKPVTTFSVGLVLILYFIETISKITEGISGIGYLSPFRYARVDAVSQDYGLDAINLLFFIGLSFLLGILAWSIYRRKDIYL
jgi:ABC-2 type transport system permease protein